MTWGVGFSPVLDVNGFNYSLGSQDTFHSSYPYWPIIGTETASLITTGAYTQTTLSGYFAAYDIQNSR